jgi:release factor glutamine methyltransferase
LDLIVSNPPYIPKEDLQTLAKEVQQEPMMALDGGQDGLDFYRAIVEQGREWLKDGGWLFFEIGYDQGEDLRNLLHEFGYTEIEVRQDLAGLDRVALGRKGEM